MAEANNPTNLRGGLKMFKKYEEMKAYYGSEKTTADMEMTPSQLDALEHAILRKMKDNARCGQYRLRSLEVSITDYGTVILSLETDNGKPGTFGYSWPSHHHLFIGRNGGYRCWRKSKRAKHGLKNVTGWRALIYC
jgi:hypothetical protein